jgi:hypothetical protein
MQLLHDLLASVLQIVLSLAPLGGLIYLFRLKPGSRRDRLVIDAVRIGYLILLGLITYAVGIIGACTGCGLALFGFVAFGLAIVLAGMRMDRLWANGLFWIASAVAILLSSSWILAGRDRADLSEVVLALIPAAAGAVTFVGLVWPIGRYVVTLIQQGKGQRTSGETTARRSIRNDAATARRPATFPRRRRGVLGWLALGSIALGMVTASAFEAIIATWGRDIALLLSVVPYAIGMILGIAGIMTGESKAKPIIAIGLAGLMLLVWGYFLLPVISR